MNDHGMTDGAVIPRSVRARSLSPTLAILTALIASVTVAIRTRPAERDPSERLLQARVSGQAYAPYRPVRGDTRKPALADLAEAGRLQDVAEREPSAPNLHGLGVALLSLPNTERAAELLGKAATLEPDNAVVLSDLAAADLATGRIGDAAERSATALERNPSLNAAAFNWALSLELLSNRPAAIDAWEKYLRLDAQSQWAAEAREHLEVLREPRPNWEREKALINASTPLETIRRIARDYPQRARHHAQEEILARWVEHNSPGDLELLRTIADVRAEAGDPFLRDVVAHASRAADLRPGIGHMLEGRAKMRARDMRGAAEQFDAAATLLARTGSPLSLSADVYAANNEFYDGRSGPAIARLDRIDSLLARSGKRYHAVSAEAAWVRALVMARLGRSQESLVSYRRALEHAKRANESEHVAALSALLANHLGRIGDAKEAERHRIEALQRLEDIGADPQRLYVAYSQAAYAELRARRPRVALAFIRSQRRIADDQGDPLLNAETDAEQALALRDLGRLRAAALMIESARQHASAIPTEGLRDRTISDIDYIAGTLDLQSDPDGAVSSLTSAIDTWQRYGWRIRTAVGHLARGDAHIARSDAEAAEEDFRAGIAEMEAERRALDEPQLRVAYFERADQLFERLIGLLLEQRRFEDAFAIAERKRARVLLDRLATDATGFSANPLSAREITAALPPDITLVQFTMVEDRIAVWLLRRERLLFAWAGASRSAVESAVGRHLAAITGNDVDTVRREGRFLFDQLMKPVAQAIHPASMLVIVGDGSLETLPFATLVDNEQRYLVERHTIATAPGSTVFVRLDQTGRDSVVTLLSVAQPAPAGLPRLPEAAAEAREVARIYRRGELFTGTTITPEEFLRRAGEAGVVHFSGHAAWEPNDPAQSALLFEAESGLPARMTTQTIAAARFSSRPLVVLAACSTGRGTIRRNEGPDSLATAFLRAGARGVVATFWDIEDQPSARLFRRLHLHLRDGVPAAEALRMSQLAMLRSTDVDERVPSAWASAFVTGSR